MGTTTHRRRRGSGPRRTWNPLLLPVCAALAAAAVAGCGSTPSVPENGSSRPAAVDAPPRPERLRYFDLAPAEIERHPVWRFLRPEERDAYSDASTVVPYRGPLPPDPSKGPYVARAAFTLADGSEYTGYLLAPVSPSRDVKTLRPVLVVEGAHIPFWLEGKPSPERLYMYYRSLGREADAIFPVRFRSEAPLEGGPIEGTVRGFSYPAPGEIKTVR